MKTGFSLCGNTTQGKPCSGPVLALQGIAVYQNPCLLQCYSSYFTFVLGHLVAAARRCGGGVGWPVFSLRPIHAMSPQGSPNLVLPSIVQVGGISSTNVRMHARRMYV
jgi:hypothetical protein